MKKIIRSPETEDAMRKFECVVRAAIKIVREKHGRVFSLRDLRNFKLYRIAENEFGLDKSEAQTTILRAEAFFMAVDKADLRRRISESMKTRILHERPMVAIMDAQNRKAA